MDFRIYRTAEGEISGRRGFTLSVISLSAFFYAGVVFALPQDGAVVGGSASIVAIDNQSLQVIQQSDRAMIDWGQFNIGANEQVQFIQPSADAAALNRVVGADPSHILGRLSANGQLFLINPNGILFGKNAVLDVSGLVATTFDIDNTDFMGSRYHFSQVGVAASVINQGTIVVDENGFVLLAASGVSNEGMIVAQMGTVALGSGERFSIDFSGDGLVHFSVDVSALAHSTTLDGTPLSSVVSNSGLINAAGGHVMMTARGSTEIFSSVINQSGIIQANSMVNRGGVIKLLASDRGGVVNSGTLNVSGVEAGAAPGSIAIVGQSVVHSGVIMARGGTLGGDGGAIEISGKETFSISGTIDAGAPHGEHGTILLDPKFIDVKTVGGTITPAQIDAFVGNIFLLADTDITFTDSVTITTSGEGLTARAGRDILVNGNIITNNGAITLIANDTEANLANRDLGAGDIVMANGTTVASGGADIALTVGVSSTGGNILMSLVDARTGSLRVTSSNGAILDNNDAAKNVIANTLTMVSVSGVGTSLDSLETVVAQLDVTSTGMGPIFIDETDALSNLTVRVNNSRANITFQNGLNALNISEEMVLSARASGTNLVVENTQGRLTIGTVGSVSGVVTTSGGASGGSIKLIAAGYFTGDMTIRDLSIPFEVDAGLGEVVLVARGEDRLLEMETGTSIRGEGGVILIADRMHLRPLGSETRVVAASSLITLSPSSIRRAIYLGRDDIIGPTATTGVLGITDAERATLRTFGDIRIGQCTDTGEFTPSGRVTEIVPPLPLSPRPTPIEGTHPPIQIIPGPFRVSSFVPVRAPLALIFPGSITVSIPVPVPVPALAPVIEEIPLAALVEVLPAPLDTLPIEDVYFDFDRSNIRSEARQQLAENIEWLLAHPNVVVVLEGHADLRGNLGYNIALAKRRIASVKNILIRMGVAESRLETLISYGEERPQCIKDTRECYQLNRRVHFAVKGEGEKRSGA
jgi:filamentous hemagglutinin family protein